MTSIILCIIAVVASFIAARRSWVLGLFVMFAFGYAYGIIRANIDESYAHFTFDAAVIGFYLAQWRRILSTDQRPVVNELRNWLFILTLWPLILFFIPAQDTMVQLVGLRGAIFLLPFMMLGVRMNAQETYQLALALAVLNLGAFVVAIAEYFLGIERFIPQREVVTTIIYLSNDVTDNMAYRIPATFSNAHSYAGTMVMTLPLLLGAWVQPNQRLWQKVLIAAALLASLMGVFMAATRMHSAILILLLLVATGLKQLGAAARLGWVIILALVGWVVSSEERLQRFTSLSDTDMVRERLRGSLNESFLSAASDYPLGNGLGGGGTSLPYFLQERVVNPIWIENEYARILLEQGIPGLCLWVAFIAWLLIRGIRQKPAQWSLGRRLAWVMCICYFAIAVTGTGLLIAIPCSCLLLLCAGWAVIDPVTERARVLTHRDPQQLPKEAFVRVH